MLGIILQEVGKCSRAGERLKDTPRGSWGLFSVLQVILVSPVSLLQASSEVDCKCIFLGWNFG